MYQSLNDLFNDFSKKIDSSKTHFYKMTSDFRTITGLNFKIKSLALKLFVVNVFSSPIIPSHVELWTVYKSGNTKTKK